MDEVEIDSTGEIEAAKTFEIFTRDLNYLTTLNLTNLKRIQISSEKVDFNFIEQFNHQVLLSESQSLTLINLKFHYLSLEILS